jgi:hypothetical protein
MALYNYIGKFMEGEIVFGAFGVARFRPECCVTLEATFDKDDVTHQ